MKVTYNASAMMANNALTKNDNRLSASLQRLSSGLKIVNAKDNPSGLAMGKRMNAQIEGISVATQNASDGVSIVETADGTLGEIHEMLQRLNELAVKAENGTLTDNDREIIDEEVQQLKAEIQRMADTTEFNSQTILDGSFDLKGYTDNNSVKIATYSEETPIGDYDFSKLSIVYDENGTIDTKASEFEFTAPNGTAYKSSDTDPLYYISSATASTITLSGPDSAEIVVELRNLDKDETDPANPLTSGAETSTKEYKPFTASLTGLGALTLQIGSNEGQTLDIRIPGMTLESMGLSGLNVRTAEEADKANVQIKNAIAYVSNARSNLGAYQNRLEHSIASLDITSENMTSAYSRIMDVDMAEEMTEYTTYQVLTQASTSMLAQANERPSQILQLLQ